MLYEELILNKDGQLILKNEYNYPDAYDNYEVEIISKEKVIELLKRGVI